MTVAPTEKDTIFENGTAQVYRFRRDEDIQPAGDRPAVLLVPSLINRWYILDLREGASMVQALLDDGFDVYALDWGIPNDEDRFLSWEQVLARLRRSIAAVKRFTGDDSLGMLGYCMGGTLAAIHLALHPDSIDAYVSLTAPIDFDESGLLGRLVDEQWFDPEAITSAGNLAPRQMQSGFVALRPTGQISKWVTLADRITNPSFVEAFKALETWVNDNIPFPAEAYQTYIQELYQQNRLVEGTHHVGGRQVDLGDISCPLLTLAASRDNICPPRAARALNDMAGSEDTSYEVVSGGHVGAVVGSKGPRELYPRISEWFAEKLGATEPAALSA